MKGAILQGSGRIDVEYPKCSRDGVMNMSLEVGYCAICGSDKGQFMCRGTHCILPEAIFKGICKYEARQYTLGFPSEQILR